MRLILASASPRRAEILRNAGLAFEVRPARVDETRMAGEGAEDYVRRLAEAKAQFVAQRTARENGPAIVLGADTVVVLGGGILGKPSGADDARRMLRLLSGTTHEVLTGVSLVRISDGGQATAAANSIAVETTRATFVELSEREIEDYVATGEPLDKAGAYGIQGIGGRFVSRIEGCYFNVMGLPISRVWLLLRELGAP